MAINAKRPGPCSRCGGVYFVVDGDGDPYCLLCGRSPGREAIGILGSPPGSPGRPAKHDRRRLHHWEKHR